jgi:hypothetical protein
VGWRGNQLKETGKMANIRSIIVSVTILASFLLVLAAPIRWF